MTLADPTTHRSGSMRVVVTGHNGYIGSVMVAFLRAAGHEVVGLDTFFFEDCVLGEDGGHVPTIRRDIRDVTVSDLSGFDAVVHLAALCNDPLGDLNPDWTFDINHHASVRLARVAREAGVGRFLYASSCSMYGAAGEDILSEEAPLRPLTPYAVSKVRTEEDVAKLADSSFSPVFMRNATAYGLMRFSASSVVGNATLAPSSNCASLTRLWGGAKAMSRETRTALRNFSTARWPWNPAMRSSISRLAHSVRNASRSCSASR